MLIYGWSGGGKNGPMVRRLFWTKQMYLIFMV